MRISDDGTSGDVRQQLMSIAGEDVAAPRREWGGHACENRNPAVWWVLAAIRNKS